MTILQTATTLVEGMEVTVCGTEQRPLKYILSSCDCCPEHPLWWRSENDSHICYLCYDPMDQAQGLSQKEMEALEEIWRDELWFKQRQERAKG